VAPPAALAKAMLDVPGMPGELERVEHELTDAVQASGPFLTEVAGHLIYAGGKRARPALAIASAGTGRAVIEPVAREVILGGVAVELVQVGSLCHDDVMDEATTRRGVETVNAKWGNLQAILAGDFLLARASEIAASLGVEVAGLLAKTIGVLAEGQTEELQSTYDADRAEEAYLASISGKTASLFATSCRIGAITGGLDGDEEEALTEYGQGFGMAFQIVDDVLDVIATDEQLGKPAGHDLLEGVYTLPVLRTMAADPDGELRTLLGGPIDASEWERARTLVRDGGAVEDSLGVAAEHVADARAALDRVRPGPSTAALAEAADRLLAGVQEIAQG
jgi:heptaprenyl diphosphate synthase